MYKRIINPPDNKSFFLFGPRGVGKTTYLKRNFQNAIYINLLEDENYVRLSARPGRLETYIPDKYKDWVIIDEVQKVPDLLNEVHRLIEEKKTKFILTGSSARKLRQKNVNLLAGRALTYSMYPLTSQEIGTDFRLETSLNFGNLPSVYQEQDPQKYLNSYVKTYLDEEVKQEGLTRNLGLFNRFLETASFSQGSVLNISQVARDCAINRKLAENYFSILNDLLIAYYLPPFTKRAKRRNVLRNKFYFFDAGVYRTVRPKGPLDSPEEIDGVCLETLVLQELKALNEYLDWECKLYFWRTIKGEEVDFVLYGANRFLAFEVKRKRNIGKNDLKNLKLFLKDYPEAKGYFLYGGDKFFYEDSITIMPLSKFFDSGLEW